MHSLSFKQIVEQFQASARLSTTSLDPKIRTDIWREMAGPVFDVTPIDPGMLLEGEIAARGIGGMVIGPSLFNAQRYKRDRQLVLSSGLDQYKVQLFFSGSVSGYCEGRPFHQDAGDISAFDMARSMQSQSTAGSNITLFLPRTLIDKAAGGKTVHGAVLKASEPMTRVVSHLLMTLAELAGRIDSQEEQIIEEAASTLLGSALAEKAPPGTQENAVMMHMLRRRILDHIDANLVDPDLGPDTLVQKFRVSRAHLYRVFAPDGGVAKVIREKRLNACYLELVTPAAHSRSITEIAYRYGFGGSNQFLRAFRAHFEMTPTDARARGYSRDIVDRKSWNLQNHFSQYFNVPAAAL